jgi:hypothetical protein
MFVWLGVVREAFEKKSNFLKAWITRVKVRD